MIKNFVYLDEQKMYSLSSQIFEGITEYVLNENSTGNENAETQKGPVGSGRILADVIKSNSKATEKKFFHDYSYSIFEKHILDEKWVMEISEPYLCLNKLKENVGNYSFIKVKAKATFNDVEKITELFTSFNTIGEALAYVGAFEEIEQLKLQLDEMKGKTKDRNEKSQLESKYKSLTNISKLAKEKGLYKDPKFLNDLSLLTKYGFSDQFEVHQVGGESRFTSCLKREFLRESEDLLIKKYSRKTEKEIIVVGLISQAFSRQEIEPDEQPDYQNMKAAIVDLVEHLSNMENSLSGKQENEVVIDPIAVYFEV